MKVSISELTGIALNYAIVKAMGLVGADKFYSSNDRLYVYGKEPPGGPQFGATESDFDIELTQLNYEKDGMFILKLINEDFIAVSPKYSNKTNVDEFIAYDRTKLHSQIGSTPGLAVLRFFIQKHLCAPEIEIPEVVYKEWKK